MSKCGMCSDKIARKPIIICAGVCNKSFHAACVNIPPDITPLLLNIEGLFWKCHACLSISRLENQLQKNIEEKFQTLVDDFMEKFSELKTAFLTEASNKMSQMVSNDQVNFVSQTNTYAQKARMDKSRIILKPKNQNQRNTETKKDILSTINPTDVNIHKVKHLNNGGILLGCENQAESSKVMEIAERKLAEKYEIQQLKELHPRVTIVGMTQDIDEERLVSWIRKQNQDIFGNSNIEVLRMWPTRRNNSVYQVTLQLNEEVFRKVMSRGSVLVGLDTCTVYEAFKLTRCFKCNSFNHSSKSCQSILKCPLCAESHLVKDCKVNDSTQYKCSNCTLVNQKQNSKIDTNHAAWNYKSCHTYKQALEKFKFHVLGPQ